MRWVAWRQFRTQALVALALLAAFAALVLVTGLHLRDYCRVGPYCSIAGLGYEVPLDRLLAPLLLAIPALLGMFWGAPLLARELESGTHRLAWTQSVSRRRWLSVKVALVTLAAIAVAGVSSWLVSWWYAPLDAMGTNHFDPGVFDARGIVALGYAGLAVALGIAAGAMMRRTLPAMAATLLAFVAARVAFTYLVRPHLLAPRRAILPLTAGKGLGLGFSPAGLIPVASGLPPPNAGMASSLLVGPAGGPIAVARLHDLLVRDCPRLAAGTAVPGHPGLIAKGGGPPFGALQACQRALSPHLRVLVTYQPASHYWPLQALETAIHLLAALALIAATIWRLGHRAARPPSLARHAERAAGRLAAVEVGAATARDRETR